MSNFPNNPAYNHGGASGQYAVMTPPPRQEKKVLPLAYTAGGGLLVGVVAGLILISGGSATKAVAANAPIEDEKSVEAAEGESAPLGEAATAEAGAVGSDKLAGDEPANIEPVEEEADPEPELLQAALTFDVTPPDVLADIKIEVDGESLGEGSELLTLTLDPSSGSKTVRVVAVASGYRDFEKSIHVKSDLRVPIKMRKVPEPKAVRTPAENSGRRKGPKNTGNKTTGPGGLLDL